MIPWWLGWIMAAIGALCGMTFGRMLGRNGREEEILAELDKKTYHCTECGNMNRLRDVL